MDFDSADVMMEKLRIAIAALEEIAASDPGPAYFIAGIALGEISAVDSPATHAATRHHFFPPGN